MHKRTVIDRIEIEPQTGNVGVRMRKQLVNDDGSIDELGYHRTMIDAGGNPAAQVAAVDAHLATLGFPAVKTEDISVLNLAIAPLASMRATKAAEQAAREASKP